MKDLSAASLTTAWLTAESEVAALVRLFMEVAQEEAWQPGSALVEHALIARHLAITAEGVLLGGVQVVLPNLSGYRPYASVWPEVRLDAPERTAHITVLAVRATRRGRPLLFWSLCAELWRSLIAAGMESVVLEATPTMFAQYRRLGFPLSEVGALRPHFGEPCLLAHMDLRSVAGAMLIQAGRSPIYRTLIDRAMRPMRAGPCETAEALP